MLRSFGVFSLLAGFYNNGELNRSLLLFSPEITPYQTAHYSCAIGALSAALEEAGHKASLLHYTKPVNEKELIKSIREESPDIVGLTATTNTFRRVKKMAISIKRHFDFPLASE